MEIFYSNVFFCEKAISKEELVEKRYAFSEISLETRIKLYFSLVTVKTKENSIRYSNVF